MIRNLEARLVSFSSLLVLLTACNPFYSTSQKMNSLKSDYTFDCWNRADRVYPPQGHPFSHCEKRGSYTALKSCSKELYMKFENTLNEARMIEELTNCMKSKGWERSEIQVLH